MTNYFSYLKRLLWVVCSALVFSCGDKTNAPVEIVINGNGPAESTAHGNFLPEPRTPPKTLCDTIECCEKLLSYEDSECQKLLLEKGKCRIEPVEDGAPCGEIAEGCGAVQSICDAGECNIGKDGEDCSKLKVAECETVTCSEDTATCVVEFAVNGTECGDGNPCNGAETCELGQCVNGEPLNCDDKNSCTTDTCGESGCEYTANIDKACDDDNVCTLGDTCDAAGTCIGGANICSCENDEDCSDKGDACTGSYKCVGVSCQPSNNPKNCDDGNPCTDDTCNPVSGDCEFKNNANDCNDDDLCTTNDVCTEGACAGTDKTCDDGDECTVDDQCDPESGKCTFLKNTCQCQDANDCPEGNKCEGTYDCINSTCVIKADSVVDCSQSQNGPCETAVCNPETGACDNQQKPNDEACDDGNQCTTDDKCVDGKCEPSGTLKCEDDKICTKDECAPASGCQFVPLAGQPCSDDNKCTIGDTCLEGECKGAAPANCDDDNACTKDSCDPLKGCSNIPLTGTQCDDGDKCTVTDQCLAGECTPGKNTCGCASDDECENDDNACNGTMICKDSKCIIKPESIVVCENSDDIQTCTAQQCNPKSGQCESTNVKDGTGCNDNNKCTSGDVCLQGQCTGALTNCDDGSECTKEKCLPLEGCVIKPVEGECDDGTQCTVDDFCNNGKCQSGKAIECDDGNLCTSDFCLPKSGCKYGKASGVCTDGDPCTVNDLCLNGKCVSEPKICDAPDKCHTAQCDGDNGECVETPVICEDDNSCTENLCKDSSGCHFPAKNCDDNLSCTEDSCDESTPNGCINVALGCNDDDPCTDDSCDAETGQCLFAAKNCDDENNCTNDSCQAGKCTNTPLKCDDLNPCTDDFCDNGKCVFTAKSCDDGIDCTDDGCLEGQCSHIAGDENCDDDNVCTANLCIPAEGGCTYTQLPEKNSSPCDDNNDDTIGDFCLSGHCAGMTITDIAITGVSQSTALSHATWSGDKFYVAGAENIVGKDDSFVAEVEGITASTIKTSVIEAKEYVALTGPIALTEDADVLFYSNGKWAWNSSLDKSLNKTQVSNATAGWGFTSQSTNAFFFAGRSPLFKGGAWTVRCIGKKFNCNKINVNMGDYNFSQTEYPRAIGGWYSGASYAAVMLADGKASSSKNYNDSFTIKAGAKSWSTSYLDNSSSAATSTDVAGINSSHLWWVGTNGLLRKGLTAGSPAWSSISAFKNQSNLSFYGVEADTNIVVMVGIRKLEQGVQLILATHNPLPELNDDEAWHEYVLDEYDIDNDFLLPRLTDVAMNNGNIVASGYRVEKLVNGVKSLLVTRKAPDTQ